MISYEQALQLKRAGFPQEGLGQTVRVRLNGGEIIEDLYYPTLDELIEACGDKFFELMVLHPNRWKALSTPEAGTLDGKGSTPEEAVSRLFIALKENENKKTKIN